MSVESGALRDFVRIRVSKALNAEVARLEFTPRAVAGWVVYATAADGRRAVVKVAEASASAARFERTAAVIGRADRAGVPVPRVLAADDFARDGPWSFIVLEYVEGTSWRQLRRQLGDAEVRGAHHQIGAALAALHTVRFASFGEVDSNLRPDGDSLLDALRQRAARRISGLSRRSIFDQALANWSHLFDPHTPATLCHDDLHHDNLLFRRRDQSWELAAVLDWDKAWAGPAESDCARAGFWDDMTGPGFWEAYPESRPGSSAQRTRAAVYQLLWCLEYEDSSPRHVADTANLRRRLRV